MKKYYLHNGIKQDGPFSIAELTAKNIRKDTKIWYEGITDWTTAGKIDELKGIIKSTTPPPIKENVTPTPPPLNKQNTEKKVESKKKRKNWKSIFFKIAIAIAVLFGGLAIYSKIKSGNDRSGNSYYEKVISIEETEQGQPTVFLEADGNYNKNIWGDKLKVHGTITNSATVATFKDAVVRVTYYSKTKTVLGSNDYTIYELFPPNSVKSFELSIDNYKHVKTIGWEVIDAHVSY